MPFHRDGLLAFLVERIRKETLPEGVLNDGLRGIVAFSTTMPASIKTKVMNPRDETSPMRYEELDQLLTSRKA